MATATDRVKEFADRAFEAGKRKRSREILRVAEGYLEREKNGLCPQTKYGALLQIVAAIKDLDK